MAPSVFISPNDFKWAYPRNCQTLKLKQGCTAWVFFCSHFSPSSCRISRINIASQNMEKKKHQQASIGNWYKIYTVFLTDNNVQEFYIVTERL